MIWKQNWGYNCIEKNRIFTDCEEKTESEKIIIVEMFDEREDFMYKLFGISTRTQKSIDYWGDED